jgi:hypothetical protein
MYGAYLHCRPDGSPFYVGKGTRKRMGDMTTRNPRHKNTTDKYGRINILKGFMECSTEQIALDLEVGIIKCFRRMGVDLANYSDGGESGVSGYKWTDAQRLKQSKAHTGKVLTDLQKKAIGDANRGNAKPTRTAEHKKNLGDKMKNRRWYNNGTNVVFCHEGNQPTDYELGRRSVKLTSLNKGGSRVQA